ncbi:hypothetical protein FQA39_LY11038 [Lamprigera yunnana]|nr:hypothetical protein FQA39_LY11038 [Lamprigera yunnana]
MSIYQGGQIHVQDNIISVPAAEIPFKYGIGRETFDKLQKYQNEIAQVSYTYNQTFFISGKIDASAGEVDPYKSYFLRCVRTAITMRKKGIKENDIITVCSNQQLNTIIPTIASFFLGVIPSSIDPSFTLKDSTYLLRQVSPKMIFVSTDAVGLIENTLEQLKITPEVVVFGATERHTPFSDFLIESVEEQDFQPIDITDLKQTAVIHFSSGTTSFPKAVCINHLSVYGLLGFKVDNQKNMPIFFASPTYWISFTILNLMLIFNNHSRLIIPRFAVDDFWGMVEKYEVTSAVLSRTQIAGLLEAPDPRKYNLSSLKLIISGGTALLKEQIMKMRTLLPNTIVLCAYGATELSGNGLAFDPSNPNDLKLALKNVTSCGLPKPGLAYKIHDIDTGKALGPNKLGELRVQTEYAMNGYYNMDSSNLYDADGFLKTGDIAYYDEDYCFYIVDRIREVFKYQNWQVSPSKIQTVLLDHPAVQNAVVIGVPHPIDGERPTALVVLHQDHVGKVTESDIVNFVDGQVVDSHRLRGGVIFVKKLLKTPTDKFKNCYMRQLVIDNKIHELQ